MTPKFHCVNMFENSIEQEFSYHSKFVRTFQIFLRTRLLIQSRNCSLITVMKSKAEKMLLKFCYNPTEKGSQQNFNNVSSHKVQGQQHRHVTLHDSSKATDNNK